MTDILLTERGDFELDVAEKLDEILALTRTEYAPVKVTLKRSSTKDGGEGWDIDVRSNATAEDVQSAVSLALAARDALIDGLYPSVEATP
jgi:hypothetical protein